MAYKVFFVEDEVVTREGIRDNVDWQAQGFEFCGEAADGELALPLLKSTRPDVLITDIKMPFMDGLQLSKIVREHMPWIKIVILSGHDEFEYAQRAISIGVTDYLLKPVTVNKLHQVLQKLAAQLEQERKGERELRMLQEQAEENQSSLQERLLLKLVMGAISSTDAIEQGQLLGFDLIAEHYKVVILRVELRDRTEQFDYVEFQRVQQKICELVENQPDCYYLKKDWDELVLLLKSSMSVSIEDKAGAILQKIREEIQNTRYQLTIGVGNPKNRVADIGQSFIEALVDVQHTAAAGQEGSSQAIAQAELLKVDKSAVEYYLRCGTMDGFDEFFNAFIQPISETALKSSLLKTYIFVDVIIATANLVQDLGGEIDLVLPELNSIEAMLSNIQNIEQLREQVHRILINPLVFRDSQSYGQHARMIQRAKEFIEDHYLEADLSLFDVAKHVNLSCSHFSMVFSQETQQTFKEFLTEVRIKKAKELLRTTSLRVVDISYQVGYNDPHYFSAVFKRNTGLSPIEFRDQVKPYG